LAEMFSTEMLLLAGFFILLFVVIVFFFRFSNKNLTKKIIDLKHQRNGLRKEIDQMKKNRMNDNKNFSHRMSKMEEKLDYILEAAGVKEKETVEEEILARVKR